MWRGDTHDHLASTTNVPVLGKIQGVDRVFFEKLIAMSFYEATKFVYFGVQCSRMPYKGIKSSCRIS